MVTLDLTSKVHRDCGETWWGEVSSVTELAVTRRWSHVVWIWLPGPSLHTEGICSEKVRYLCLAHENLLQGGMAHEERKRLAVWSWSPPNPPAQCLPGEGRVRGGAGRSQHSQGSCLHPEGTVLRGQMVLFPKIQDRKWQPQHLSQSESLWVVFPSFPSHSLSFLSFLCHWQK